MDAITINGRQFKGVSETTLEHDVWNQERIKECGLNELRMFTGETPDEFASRLYMSMISGTDVFMLLGGLLLPFEAEPLAWTPAMAKETGDFLKKCHKPEDKRAVQTILASTVVGFLMAGLISLRVTPKSLNHLSAKKPVSPTAEAPNHSENGPDLSVN